MVVFMIQSLLVLVNDVLYKYGRGCFCKCWCIMRDVDYGWHTLHAHRCKCILSLMYFHMFRVALWSYQTKRIGLVIWLLLTIFANG